MSDQQEVGKGLKQETGGLPHQQPLGLSPQKRAGSPHQAPRALPYREPVDSWQCAPLHREVPDEWGETMRDEPSRKSRREIGYQQVKPHLWALVKQPGAVPQTGTPPGAALPKDLAQGSTLRDLVAVLAASPETAAMPQGSTGVRPAIPAARDAAGATGTAVVRDAVHSFQPP
ncbi:hypothetical protein HMPREF0573_10658 [Mobiluncus curtisii ATCC 43063]|uniref:Uncharacterized protein n=1 Tax=Mobiluncus curtisii (strain ATCC 43063 / DSM 2711 / V125) TaxID=548479 RepID=D6ZJS8_MOBCV|nr:hypothetical protein HMPREF0573_10658 [Mobiluncus curtisii ATCC 43063]